MPRLLLRRKEQRHARGQRAQQRKDDERGAQVRREQPAQRNGHQRIADGAAHADGREVIAPAGAELQRHRVAHGQHRHVEHHKQHRHRQNILEVSAEQVEHRADARGHKRQDQHALAVGAVGQAAPRGLQQQRSQRPDGGDDADLPGGEALLLVVQRDVGVHGAAGHVDERKHRPDGQQLPVRFEVGNQFHRKLPPLYLY